MFRKWDFNRTPFFIRPGSCRLFFFILLVVVVVFFLSGPGIIFQVWRMTSLFFVARGIFMIKNEKVRDEKTKVCSLKFGAFSNGTITANCKVFVILGSGNKTLPILASRMARFCGVDKDEGGVRGRRERQDVVQLI